MLTLHKWKRTGLAKFFPRTSIKHFPVTQSGLALLKEGLLSPRLVLFLLLKHFAFSIRYINKNKLLFFKA